MARDSDLLGPAIIHKTAANHREHREHGETKLGSSWLSGNPLLRFLLVCSLCSLRSLWWIPHRHSTRRRLADLAVSVVPRRGRRFPAPVSAPDAAGRSWSSARRSSPAGVLDREAPSRGGSIVFSGRR